MNSHLYIIYTVLIGLLALSPLHSTLADEDYKEAKRLLESGEILPLEKILENVRKTSPGKVLEVDLEKKKGRIVYEIEVLGKDGVVRKIYINARNGEIISIREDD